jgi:hypothetical protein
MTCVGVQCDFFTERTNPNWQSVRSMKEVARIAIFSEPETGYHAAESWNQRLSSLKVPSLISKSCVRCLFR